MKKYNSISILLLLAVGALPAASALDRIAVTPAEIAAVVSRAGMPISPGQVTLLSEVVTASGSPTLEVQSVERWSEHRMKVRLRCAKPGECLPFFVAVNWNDTNAVLPEIVHPGVQSSTNSQSRKPAAPATVRVGSSAILLIDEARVHIRVSVNCLESGIVGDTIRVASKDSHKIYTAEIVGPALLKGRL